jgi:hypothetical protein
MYHNSQVFSKNDDASWANRMVFLLAEVLSFAFHPEPNDGLATLQQVSGEIEDWADRKPASFSPIMYKPRSRDEGRAFPEIWMLLPFHGKSSIAFHY